MLLGTAAWAQQPEAAPPAPKYPFAYKGFTASGVFDAYYSWNNNHPATHYNLYRNFDVRPDRPSINMGKLTFEHAAEPIGFKVDFGFGRAFEVFHSTELDRGEGVARYLPQAYVSLKVPKTNGLQFDFGKFYTSAGAELTETHLNWNYSRALLYANGPYYHFGVRMTKPITSSFTAGMQVINGWNNVWDNNGSKTVGFTTAFTQKKFSWFNSYYVGNENPRHVDGRRHFYDTVLLLTPNDMVNFYVNFDYGTNKVRSMGSNDFLGVAGAAKINITKKVAISPRLEWYYDKDGFITGTSQRLKEFTLTGEYKWVTNFLTRLEFRRDWSDNPVFDRGTAPGVWRNQNTLLIGLVAFMSPPAGN